MKYIRSFLQKIQEGAYINPENFDEVILTFSNLKKNDAQYNNEVLVTLVDNRGKKASNYILDKYFALLLASDNIGGSSASNIKELDHVGRPKATMDLLKAGKIKGGQDTINDFLGEAIPKIGDMKYITYVCSLDSTGPLVKMMENFFIEKYRSIPVDLKKAIFTQISDIFKLETLIDELIASEKKIKDDYKEKLKLYKDQEKIISNLEYRGVKMASSQKKYEEPFFDASLFTEKLAKNHTSILNKFLSAIEESLDILSTDYSVYKKYNDLKKQVISNIISIYLNYCNCDNPLSNSVKSNEIYDLIKVALDKFLNTLQIQPNYKLRTSGTAIGASMRKIFKDKYQYDVSFEEAVLDCIMNNKKMLIIDDNINTGTDFRTIDKKIQDIFEQAKLPISKKIELIKNIKMFVLYDMGSKVKMKLNSKEITSVSTDPADVTDFKISILNKRSRIPSKVNMSYIINTSKQTPSPSMPIMKLKIDNNGVIQEIDYDYSKTKMSKVSQYDKNADPKNWKFPFEVGDTIFNEDATLTDNFKGWAKNIGIWINGEKFDKKSKN